MEQKVPAGQVVPDRDPAYRAPGGRGGRKLNRRGVRGRVAGDGRGERLARVAAAAHLRARAGVGRVGRVKPQVDRRRRGVRRVRQHMEEDLVLKIVAKCTHGITLVGLTFMDRRPWLNAARSFCMIMSSIACA